jgi:hypothetical protein
LACPICNKRKAKRFCPARAETICSVCCGTEREVTLDCPSDCEYLKASREYDLDRRDFDPDTLPFRDVQIPNSFVREHGKLLDALAYAVSLFARENRPLVDSDVVATLRSLAETYRTLASGLIYENPPEYNLQRRLYQSLRRAIDDYRQAEQQQLGLGSTRDGEIRDALILFAQIAATHANGRPKGRAYIDFLGNQFAPGELPDQASNIILPY